MAALVGGRGGRGGRGGTSGGGGSGSRVDAVDAGRNLIAEVPQHQRKDVDRSQGRSYRAIDRDYTLHVFVDQASMTGSVLWELPIFP